MALNEAEIFSIEMAINTLQANGHAVAPGLRRLFPGITFVRCNAADMDVPPYRDSARYQLYLMDRSQGCIRLTAQPDDADGIIVAEVE